MKRLLECVVVLALVGTTPAAGAKPEPPRAQRDTMPAAVAAPAPGVPNVVLLTTFRSLNTDSVAAHAFVEGFRSAFLDDYFLTEAAANNASQSASAALTNRFRMVHGSAFGDEWQLQVAVFPRWGFAGEESQVDTLGGRYPGTGLGVYIDVQSPRDVEAGKRPASIREFLAFNDLPETRRDQFAAAGRWVGLLVIQALHHRSGDLDAELRVRIEGAVRVREIELKFSRRR